MGCWYGTCGLSQMPIREGEKIVLFPLLKNEHADVGGHGFTYSHNQYAPISVPLFGEYDDYGGIENISKNGEFVFRLFQNAQNGEEGNLLKLNEKEVKRQKAINKNYTGTPKDIKELIDTYLAEPIYEGIGYMVVLESVYQKVLEEVATRENYRSKQIMREHYTTAAHEFLEKASLALQTSLDDLYEAQHKLREAPDKDSQENFEKRMKINEQISMHHGNFRDSFAHNPFVQYFSELGRSSYMFNKLLLQALVDTPKEAQNALVDGYVNLILFDVVMDLTRKLWTPQAGAGSQSRELYLHQLIAQSVFEKKEKRIEQYLEDNIVEEDEMDSLQEMFKETLW